jgi:NADPH2:quinone reductase
MRAIVATALGGPEVLTLEDVAAPRPAAGQVTIDVHYAGVNFAEVMGRRGSIPSIQAPFVPGLEVSGIVRELGPGVDDLAIGDPVCALTLVGGYAEIARAPAGSTYRLPDAQDATLRWGAALPTIVPTATAVVQRIGAVRTGETVVVSAAAGGMGTLLGQLARRAGASRVLGVASTAAKRDYARSFGYDDVLAESGLREAASDIAETGGIDVVFDSVGGGFRDLAFDLLAPLGRLVVFGNASDAPARPVDPEVLRTSCKAVIGFSISALTRRDPARARVLTEEAIALAATGDLRIDVTRIHPLSDAAAAHTDLEARRTIGKALLAIHHQSGGTP